jgi:hypothetical protein
MQADEFAPWEAELVLRGFEKTEAVSESDSFDNRFVIMARPDLRLRYVRDRSQGGIEVAAPGAPDEWFDAAVVLEMFGKLSSKEPTTMEQEMLQLVQSFDAIGTAFHKRNWQSTRRRLKAIEAGRARALFGDLLGRS